MGDFDGIPVRLCVDQFLPEHLHEVAGKLAASERPRDSVLMDPALFLPGNNVFQNAAMGPADVSSLVFQRMGLLRKAKWEPGRTISIGFYPGAPRGVESRIMQILEESSEVLYLNWRQVPVNQAEYRVAFKAGNGLWSMIGNQSLMVQGQPTCNLGDVNWSDPRDLIRCVRHEIVGHGTGCLHAQSLETYSDIVDLDLPAILTYYQRSQGWDYATAKAQFDKTANAEVEQGLQTRTSVMAYEINPQFDRNGIGVPFNWDWDLEDMAQFRRSYPRPAQPSPPPLPPPVSPDPPQPISQAKLLKWRRVETVPYQAGGVSRFRITAPAETDLTVRVQDLAAGTPLLDLVGGKTVSLQPMPGDRSDVVKFLGHLSAAGDYELLVRFTGVAPRAFNIIAEKK